VQGFERRNRYTIYGKTGSMALCMTLKNAYKSCLLFFAVLNSLAFLNSFLPKAHFSELPKNLLNKETKRNNADHKVSESLFGRCFGFDGK
jgi:hypothetical protein